MRKIIFVLAMLLSLSAHTSTKVMTNKEITLINEADAETPFSVLLTTNEADSIFLRTKCIDVPDVENVANNKDVQRFIERLKLTLEAESGVGIAAPQVGVGRNLFLFLRIDKEGHPVQVAINPRIVNHPEQLICFEGDGCLSIPNQSGNTARYEWIEVEYYDEKGELVKERLSGASRDTDFTGIIFQHEYDHLQGILFTDRLLETE